MRERMRRELSQADGGEFDLKQDRGGIADIEFLAQYWALKHVHDKPPLAMYPDTIRLLESVGSAGLVDHAVIDGLVDAYRNYRQVNHRRSLEGLGRVLPSGYPSGTAEWVGRVWEAVMLRDAEPPLPGAPV